MAGLEKFLASLPENDDSWKALEIAGDPRTIVTKKVRTEEGPWLVAFTTSPGRTDVLEISVAIGDVPNSPASSALTNALNLSLPHKFLLDHSDSADTQAALMVLTQKEEPVFFGGKQFLDELAQGYAESAVNLRVAFENINRSSLDFANARIVAEEIVSGIISK